jgi:general L-amino acid transport system permease protein
MEQNTPSIDGGGEDPYVHATPAQGASAALMQELKDGLFKDAKNSILTITFGFIMLYVGYRAYGFMFNNLKATPDGGLVNSWRVVRQNLTPFMVGAEFPSTGIGYPMLWGAIYTMALTLGLATGPTKGEERVPLTGRTKLSIILPPLLGAIVLLNFTETITPKILTIIIPIVYVLGSRAVAFLPEAVLQRKGLMLTLLATLIFGLETGFNPANVDSFGGLMLTINVAFISIVLCFPIGIVFALVRRSSFPLLRPISVAYIELIRGVPLISLLFMGQFALGFFLPPGANAIPSTLRSIFMVTIFSAAYVAEIVRGGLQSVPSGQVEAGQAMGLSPLTITRRIVLPQALRNSIPALVGQFIALLKDTTLLIIISQFDILGISKPLLASPDFQNQGYAPEVYAFVAFVFWIMTFSMSRASQRLETKLGVGTR